MTGIEAIAAERQRQIDKEGWVPEHDDEHKSGCSQADDEVLIQWKPINFMIYSEMFPSMIVEAAREWLVTFEMKPETEYEMIFGHVIDRDVGGAVLGEWFSPMSLKEDQHND